MVSKVQSADVAVLGAGAAGLMCAIEAGRRGRQVIVLEHAERVGKKILISGGGRCNFTNLRAGAENFHSANPHFAKSALARFTPGDIIAMVEKHRIAYHEKTLGQLFCDGSSQQIVSMLERECAAARVEIRVGTQLLSVSRDSSFLVETSSGPLRVSAVVVATGGLSIPKMGATGFGYELAEKFGLKIVPCRPALVPLVFQPEDCERWCDLTGVSTEVVASTRKLSASMNSRTPPPSFREKMLFTHRGLSGPAILQISSYWRAGEPIELDMAPNAVAGNDAFGELMLSPSARDAVAAMGALRSVLPARLAERWVKLYQPARWNNHAIGEMERQLHHWRVTPAGTEGYGKAEVTAGGVDTAELDARTMQSKNVPGLYFIGEVVDVTGWLGGYNFQWAWASGAATGRAI